MKAVQINNYGGSEVLELKEVDKPVVKDGQVLVEVAAASINPFDRTLRNGYLQKMMPLTFPVTMGGDFAGRIVETGEEVYGQAIVLNGGSGTMAEYVSVNKINLANKPKNISFVEASALPLVGVSAIQALEENIKLQAGQKILIHGGSGGIGSIAIQLAKAMGAYVITTVNSDCVDFVKKLGVDEVIDYKNQKFEEILKDIDAVYDTVSKDTVEKSFLILKKGGVLVTMLGEPDKALAEKYEVKAIGQLTGVNNDRLEKLTRLVEEGKIKPIVDKTFELNQVREAFDYQEKNHPIGKVVVSIKKF